MKSKSSLNKRSASSQEVQYIFKLLQQIAPKYKDPEDVPAVTLEAAEIIASWYTEEFENILKITSKYLFQDLLDLRDAASDMSEIKTVWPNYNDDDDDITASLKFSWKDNSNTHEDLMGEAYDLWNKDNDWNKNTFLENLPSQAHKDAVILGNFNYQVSNGGFSQWLYNGYGERDINYLLDELLSKIGTPASAKVLGILEQVNAAWEEDKINQGRHDEYEEENEYEEDYDLQDTRYYEIDEQFMADINEYLSNIRSASLKFSWLETVEPFPITFGDYIDQEALELGDFIEVEGYPKALIEALDYDNHTISLQFQEDGPINTYKFDELNDMKVKDFTAMSSLHKSAWQEVTYNIQEVSFKQLKSMHMGDEGLVALGAGGDLKQWIDGITEDLNEAGIASGDANTLFKAFFKLITTEGRTDLVMVFNTDADMDLSKMALWRLQWGGELSWISDWFDNFASHFASMHKRSWQIQDPTIFNVKARSYERRHPNIPIGAARWEEINVLENVLFEGAKNAEDVKRIYEYFWNDMNPATREIVKVLKIEPMDISKENNKRRAMSRPRMQLPASRIKSNLKGNTMEKKSDYAIGPNGLIEEGDNAAVPPDQYQSSPEVPDMDFQKWFEENKNSDLLWEEYNNYVLDVSSVAGSSGIDSFNVWMRDRFDALYSKQFRNKIIKHASKFEELKIALVQKFNFDPSLIEGQNDLYEIIAQLGPAEGITEEDVLQVVGQIIPFDFDQDRLDNIEDEAEIEDFINELDDKLKTSYFKQLRNKIIKHASSFWEIKQLVINSVRKYQQDNKEEVPENIFSELQEAKSANDILEIINAWFGGEYETASKFILDSIVSDSVYYSSKTKNLQKQASQKLSNGIAVNILPNLFEDKFPLQNTPRELMLLRSKARQALAGISKKLTLSGRDETPVDFPVEWFYKNMSYASPEGSAMNYSNYVAEVRSQLQDIINYGNSITGENFYASKEATVYKISRSGEKGVKILREKIDGKINRYGFINEEGTFVVLPNHRETRKTSKLQRPDTGENIMIISYEDFSLGSTAFMIEELMKKKAWGYENPHDIESQEEEAENPYANISEDTSKDNLFEYLKKRYNKIQGEADALGERIKKLQGEMSAHIKSWPEEAQQKAKNVMSSVVNHILIKEAFGASDAEVGSPQWVDDMLVSASHLDYDMSQRKEGEGTTYITDLLLDAASEQGIWANSSDALRWYDNYYNSPLYDKYFSNSNKKMPKYSIDVSDEIPPMGWDTSDPGKPAGAGAPKAPLQSLQDDEANVENKNVLYDSKNDTGPQYQVTMNPKNKEVSIKFMDSPQQQALEQTINEDTSVPQTKPLEQQLPKLNTAPSEQGVGQEDAAFRDQEVPVSF